MIITRAEVDTNNLNCGVIFRFDPTNKKVIRRRDTLVQARRGHVFRVEVDRRTKDTTQEHKVGSHALYPGKPGLVDYLGVILIFITSSCQGW